MGIEPTQSAWEAEVLPLNYTRIMYRENIIKKSRTDCIIAHTLSISQQCFLFFQIFLQLALYTLKCIIN